MHILFRLSRFPFLRILLFRHYLRFPDLFILHFLVLLFRPLCDAVTEQGGKGQRMDGECPEPWQVLGRMQFPELHPEGLNEVVDGCPDLAFLHLCVLPVYPSDDSLHPLKSYCIRRFHIVRDLLLMSAGHPVGTTQTKGTEEAPQ